MMDVMTMDVSIEAGSQGSIRVWDHPLALHYGESGVPCETTQQPTRSSHSLALVQVDYPGEEKEYRKRNGSALVGCIDPEAPLG
jgi:hypothetical protein